MATARGMWDAAKHPRGYHGYFGVSGRRKTVTMVPRKHVKPGEVARAPRIVYESIYRENGRLIKEDKARAVTFRRRPLSTIRTYGFK